VAQLSKMRPKLAVPNTALYDRVQRGDVPKSVTIHIRSLGLTNVKDATP